MTPCSVVVHGHFYQPPRENPWTDRVPRQASAAPYHDWNGRIHDECYRAVVAARILDGQGRITEVMNTLTWMSWDAGPTLLRWLEREAPGTYQAFLEADAEAAARLGHGGAIAQPYHHVILPLASRREKTTEVRWGIADFRRRFGRDPAGMWLPEAAVDTETLEVLSGEGVGFVVLAPQQVAAVPEGGWPGWVELPGGNGIAVFVYDGPLSHDVAFGAVLKDSEVWLRRVLKAASPGALVSIAADGETFGHHHEWGEMALAATLRKAIGHPDLRVENFATFLERHPPREEVVIVEPSAWSCSHGVDRWRRECGCRLDPSRPTSQAWRTVLREALEELADALHARFEEEGRTLLTDPWAARDAYGSVVDDGEDAWTTFLARHARAPLVASDVARIRELLEMERDTLRMDTSCAWFFDDIARLEPLQNLLYAAHALDLLGEGAEALEERLVRRLALAVSNDPKAGSGARFWERKVRTMARKGRAAARRADAAGAEATGARHEVSSSDAVRRALEAPSADSVGEALRALDGMDGADLFDVQTSVARTLAGMEAPGPHLRRLAERLGIAARAWREHAGA